MLSVVICDCKWKQETQELLFYLWLSVMINGNGRNRNSYSIFVIYECKWKQLIQSIQPFIGSGRLGINIDTRALYTGVVYYSCFGFHLGFFLFHLWTAQRSHFI